MAFWPRPERLLPPRLVEALAAAQAGEPERAEQLVAATTAEDPLAGGVVRLVRGLAALQQGQADQGLRLLRPLSRDREPAVALLATLALSQRHAEARRFAPAAALLRRARRRMHDRAYELYLDAVLLGLELARRGRVPADRLRVLAERLERRDPAPVHAAVQLLRSESALLAGDFAAAVKAHREARPYVQSAGYALLRGRYDAVTRLLRAPFADVEDWEEPLRPLSREEVAGIASRPWQLWVDALHRRVLQRRSRREAPATIAFARQPQLWDALAAALRAPRHTVTWAGAREALRVDSVEAARQVAEQLGTALPGSPLVLQATGYTLRSERFVFLYPSARLASTQQRLLAMLAELPGARAQELAEASALSHSNVVRHLALLRASGFVRLVGGGAQARYYLV